MSKGRGLIDAFAYDRGEPCCPNPAGDAITDIPKWRFLGEELMARLAKALGLFDAIGIPVLRRLGEGLA